MVSINFFEIETTPELFVPGTPQFPLTAKRNVLYPFFVYNNEDKKTSDDAKAKANPK